MCTMITHFAETEGTFTVWLQLIDYHHFTNKDINCREALQLYIFKDIRPLFFLWMFVA